MENDAMTPNDEGSVPTRETANPTTEATSNTIPIDEEDTLAASGLKFMNWLLVCLNDVFFVPQLPGDDECSLVPHSHYWISSKRIVTPQGIISGSGFIS